MNHLPGVSLATISKLQAQMDSPQIDIACLNDGPREQTRRLITLPSIVSSMAVGWGFLVHDVVRVDRLMKSDTP